MSDNAEGREYVVDEFEIVASRPTGISNYESTQSEHSVGGDTWILRLRKDGTGCGATLKASVYLKSRTKTSISAEVGFAESYSGDRSYDSFEKVVAYRDKAVECPKNFDVSSRVGVRIRIVARTDDSRRAALLDTADFHFVFEDGQRVAAHKGYLSMVSPVFCAMFNGEFKEKDATEVKMGSEDDPAVFEAFMNAIYPAHIPPNEETAFDLVVLADRYNVAHLLRKCERYLQKCTKVPLIDKVFCADKYGLTVLLDHVASIMGRTDARAVLDDPRSATLDSFALALLRSRCQP